MGVRVAFRAPRAIKYCSFDTQPTRIPHLRAALASKRAASTAAIKRETRSSPSHTLPAHPPARRSDPRRNMTPAPLPEFRDRVYFWGCCIFGAVVAGYMSMVVMGYRQAWQESKKLALAPNADVSDRYNKLDRDYDDEVELSEKLMLMGWKRRRLVSQAHGEVLEVSVGTGRNMKYYDWSPSEARDKNKAITRIVFNDQARLMVDVARKRFVDQEESKRPEDRFTGEVEFVEGDAGVRGVIKKPAAGFDYIIQTMGICSISDPVGFLRTLGALSRQPSPAGGSVAPGDDGLGGRILLLEHGRSYFDWLNYGLDGLAPWHADHFGCWWNKDIGAIVRESGLHIEYIKRYHGGTTWEVVLRPAIGKQEKRI